MMKQSAVWPSALFYLNLYLQSHLLIQINSSQRFLDANLKYLSYLWFNSFFLFLFLYILKFREGGETLNWNKEHKQEENNKINKFFRILP